MSRQIIEQGLGVPEVGGLETLGEPLGDGRQQVVRFLGSALRPVQAGEPHRCAKFRRLGTLLAGDLARPAEAGGRFGRKPGSSGTGGQDLATRNARRRGEIPVYKEYPNA